MRILWLGPVGTDTFDMDTARILKEARREGTVVDVLSLPPGRPFPIHMMGSLSAAFTTSG
jgi:hypothetical protein